ncbi:hypothetical protein SAMN05216238_101119 [Lentibacillus persicus]|uniref:Uncharacterized protein n=1 Tax=Lentibacillus persicus TaxID=640948 RepID=A0A1I1S5R6_9BACI|nr:hypothetical protein [Lentibacillus persicus]SFD39153.1 hypothetical protein SAMN05216238_101119 [Lentibacillus persicus]
MSEENKSLFDIWGDNVNLKDLLIAMLICIGMTLGGYVIAPGEDPQPLIAGLVGGVIGFIISSIIIKPKREINDIEEES